MLWTFARDEKYAERPNGRILNVKYDTYDINDTSEFLLHHDCEN